MPLRRHGQMRKRWRYVGLFGPRAMICVARAGIGPLSQSFWALWDRDSGRFIQRTSLRPGGGGVHMDGPRIEIADREARLTMALGEAAPVESICPSGAGWGWTRKRCGVPVAATVETEDGRLELEGHGVDDESAGYHARHTSWRWSAGVGTADDGRAVAWNLVEGINDPPRSSERAIWVDGVPREPAPVSFEKLDSVRFGGGEALRFEPGPERARDDDFLLFRSSYRHLFGDFTGSLEGLPLAEGHGVMERHDAVW